MPAIMADAASDAAETATGNAEGPAVDASASQGSPQPKSRGKKRVHIDIDDQIREANKLAGLLMKVTKAAKTQIKNGQRQKQRLVRKAGKLSSTDLERIAVLKRCGLFAGDTEADSGQVEPAVPKFQSPESKLVAHSKVGTKMAAALAGISGAPELFESMGLSSAWATSSASSSSAPCSGPPPTVRAGRLPPARRTSAVPPARTDKNQARKASCAGSAGQREPSEQDDPKPEDDH